MQAFRVLSAVYDSVHDRIEVVKEITEDDGTTNLNLHTFNPETLEWKAAEYDIDDPDELLDIIMHEPFMAELQPLQMDVAVAKERVRSEMAAVKAKFVTRSNGNGKMVTADKEEHKSRLRLAGVDSKYVAAAEESPFVVMKRHSPFDEEVIEVKRNHLQRVRQDISDERDRVQQQRKSPTERAKALTRALERSKQREAPHGSERVEHIPGKEARAAMEVKLQPIEMVRGKPVR